MRTTVELREDHRAILHAIALEKGWRGYSRVIEEAIDFYLEHHAEAEAARESLISRGGGWTKRESEDTKSIIQELRARWDTKNSSS